jgi:hypothetical protein
MPIAVAQYLRHLATRCSRMSRDCHDPLIAKELEIISFELVEKAEEVEAHYTISASSLGTGDDVSSDIVCTDDDDVK